MEEYYREILGTKISLLPEASERTEEVFLSKAKFMSAYADANFQSGAIDALTYERELSDIFSLGLDLNNSEQGLWERADARITFCTSILTVLQAATDALETHSSQLKSVRWKNLTKALGDLTAASKLSHAQNLHKIHMRRGDCELMRSALGKGPYPYDLALRSASTLLKNAEVYYRGAMKLARNCGAIEEEREASIKEAVSAKLGGNPQLFAVLLEGNREEIIGVVEDMHEECLLSSDDLRQLVE